MSESRDYLELSVKSIQCFANDGRLDRIFIGGEWVLPAGQARSAVIDRSTEGPVAEVALRGTWDSTPYHRVARPHRLNEFMYLLAGGVRFASPDGSVLSTNAGDALFVPQGAQIGGDHRRPTPQPEAHEIRGHGAHDGGARRPQGQRQQGQGQHGDGDARQPGHVPGNLHDSLTAVAYRARGMLRAPRAPATGVGYQKRGTP